MATKTQAPTSAGGMLALFVAVVVGAGFAYGFVRRENTDDGSGVEFAVAFTSTQTANKRPFVDIKITVDGKLFAEDQALYSPWKMLVPLRRGQTAVLTATQPTPNQLACAVNGDVQEATEFAGSVICTHTRVV